MKVLFFLSVTFVVAHLDNAQAVHTCDEKILNKIYQLWASEGKPTGLMEESVAASPQIIVETTAGYYAKGTTCASTVTDKDGKVTLTTVTNGVKHEETRKNSETTPGVVSEQETGVDRYHVYSKDGCACWYKCRTGKKDATDGPPEAATKIASKGYDKDCVDICKKKLGKIGIVLTEALNSCTTMY